MPTMTITQKAYRELEQAVQMSGATKDVVLENALSRYLAELQEDAEDARLAEKADSVKICSQFGLKKSFSQKHLKNN